MGLFDIFKTQWSAGEMTQEDRKKIFWYLKRNSSYTAWKRVADAYDRFVAILDKQIREQPHAPGRMNGTNWEFHYSKFLQAQVWFEQGLERLKHGDRSVWMYNDRGVLADALTRAQIWYSELVNNGAQGDKFFFGKYVDDMVKAMEEFNLANSDTGYVQSMMAEPYSSEWWGEKMKCRLTNQDFVASDGIYTQKFSHIFFPSPLPEVPEPNEETLVKSGQQVLKFGIYEPQVKDGCMNYLLADTIAPTLMTDSGDLLRVIWRLIWEDKRYLDGEIPSEESRYFPTENKPALQIIKATDDLLSTSSGKSCPQSGTWAVMDNLNASRAIKKDDRMPQHEGRDVTWVWVN